MRLELAIFFPDAHREAGWGHSLGKRVTPESV